MIDTSCAESRHSSFCKETVKTVKTANQRSKQPSEQSNEGRVERIQNSLFVWHGVVSFKVVSESINPSANSDNETVVLAHERTCDEYIRENEASDNNTQL